MRRPAKSGAVQGDDMRLRPAAGGARAQAMEILPLADRDALPEPLAILLAEYPREGWAAHPEFSGLVQFWLERHLMFRKLLARLRTDAEAAMDGSRDAMGYLAGLSRFGGMFVGDLHMHHTIEDTQFFPVLSQREARIAAGFEMLDADHHALDRYLNRFTDAANAVITGRVVTVDKVAPVLATIADLERLIDRHLTDEEELIVPVILRDGSAGLW